MSFTTLDSSDFVVSSDSVVAPAWSGSNPTLTGGFATASNNFYADVYNASPTALGSEIQFSVALGDSTGGAVAPLNTLVPGITPLRINYGQYRNLVYGDAELNFPTTKIVAITINRSRYKESLYPGTMILTVGGVMYTDNSLTTAAVNYLDCGRAYTLVQAASATTPGTGTGDFGLFLPDIGTIILTTPAAAYATSLAAAQAIAAGPFTLNSQETISANYIFARVRNSDYNYTTNPSLITGSGDFVYSNFINSPQTFITSVGLYNDNNDLLAVAKLSKPLVKDFTKEALVRIKLDW
jgi:hypothetical protein